MFVYAIDTGDVADNRRCFVKSDREIPDFGDKVADVMEDMPTDRLNDKNGDWFLNVIDAVCVNLGCSLVTAQEDVEIGDTRMYILQSRS